MKELITALAKARASFRKPKQSGRNSFDNFDYSTIVDYIEATVGALSENGLALIQKERVDTDGMFVSVKTSIYHTSGEFMEFGETICPITPKKQGAPIFTPHNVGGAITYARKYGMEVALGIDGEQDADKNQQPTEPHKKQNNAPQSRQNQQPTPKEKTTYEINPDVKEKWRESIIKGDHTAKEIVRSLEKRFELTDKQRDDIYAIEVGLIGELVQQCLDDDMSHDKIISWFKYRLGDYFTDDLEAMIHSLNPVSE